MEMQAVKKKELVGLHLIRGLCALSVMTYHYLHAAEIGAFFAIGTYGVYIFFILSGVALYYVYGEDDLSETRLRDFYIARLFRIAPLYIAIASYRLLTTAPSHESVYKYLLNASLAFGLGNPGEVSSVVGGWSIGIEFVFYLIFPAILLLRSVRSLSIVFIACLFLNHMLASLSFLYGQNGEQDWGFYTQPLTFLCYFTGGILFAKIASEHALLNRADSPWLSALIVALMVALFIGPHIAGWSKEDILSGFESKLMVAAAFIIVILGSIAKITGASRSVSLYIGDISYAVYLMHMPIFGLIRSAGLTGTTAVWAALLLTIISATLVYRYFESPMRALQWRFRSPKAKKQHTT